MATQCKLNFLFLILCIHHCLHQISSLPIVNSTATVAETTEDHLKIVDFNFEINDQPSDSEKVNATTVIPLNEEPSDQLKDNKTQLSTVNDKSLQSEINSNLVTFEYSSVENEEYVPTLEDLKIEISDIEPVYVKPPHGFKPILYPNKPIASISVEVEPAFGYLNAIPERSYPYGVVTWLLGGVRGLQKSHEWPLVDSIVERADATQEPRYALSVPEWLQIIPQFSYLTPYYIFPTPSYAVNESPYYTSQANPLLESKMPAFLLEKIKFTPIDDTTPEKVNLSEVKDDSSVNITPLKSFLLSISTENNDNRITETEPQKTLSTR